jgi:uncharacterized membrane protein/Mg-chelatase subunit ChlD
VSVFPRFIFPWALLLLVLVPWAIRVGAGIRSLAPMRKWTAIVLRSVILISLIAALAGVELVKTNDRLAVFFLLDRSNSIPEEVKVASLDAINQTCAEDMTPKDEAGVIAFGEGASIELSVDPKMELREVQSYVGGEQTDLAAALRLAMAAFPQGYMKRVVVYTDGNETQGSALEEVKLADAAGIEIDIVPIEIGGVNELRIREVSAPSRVNADEPFKLKIVVRSDQECEATLRVYQRVREGKRLLQPAKVTLQKGDNAFLVPQELAASGFYEYEAVIESDADTVMANNEGRAYTVIQGEPTVLYVEADPQHSKYLGKALKEEGLKVEEATLGGVPASLAGFQNYDAVVLSNVSATDLSSDQLRAFEALVRDMGIGLVMVGGDQSFGAGGYFNTPIERALPVNMDLKQRKVMPRGALVLIMHTCEIADGNSWAREIGEASLDVLGPQDLMGALAYNHPDGDSWLYELRPTGDKHYMRQQLNATSIGDMPDVGPTLRLACDALTVADAAVKRVVMISDGDPARPSRSLLNALVAAKISVSTICIAPHRMSDQDMLRGIAEWTGGEYYFVTNPNTLPQIFTKEAAVVRRSLLVEEPFVPQPMHTSEIVRGFDAAALPQLTGYVATTPKDNATLPLVSHEGDPVLAHWRYGLGKSVAFTSDVTPRWAADWIKWQDFNRFWAQTVRWALREVSPSNFRVDTSVKDGMGHVRIDAVDDQGTFINFLRPEGVVTGPAPDFLKQDLALMQTGPGIYEGKFPLDNRGVYMLNMAYTNEDGSRGMIPAGLALNYSREYNYNTTNFALLDQLAEVGGGAILTPADNPFQHNLTATPTITPIWQWAAVFAACLFPIEIFVRRVVVNLAPVLAWVLALLRKLPGLRRYIPVPRLRPAPVTGAYGAMSRPSATLVFKASGTDLPGGEGPAELDAIAASSEPGAFEGAPESAPSTPGHSDYTRQLLAAKQRALKRYSRRDQEPTEKEKE